MTQYEHPRPIYSHKLQRWIAVQYTTREFKNYCQLIRNLMLERKAWYYSENPLHLRLLFCFSNDRSCDLDDRVKPMQDALKQAGVYKDDSQIKILEARPGPKITPAVCLIWLDEIFPDIQANLRWIQNPVG